MQYVFPHSQASQKHVFGVDLTLFHENNQSLNLVIEETETGMLQEFYDDVSTHAWLILEGEATFVIDGSTYVARVNDLVVVPPKSRIHYFGKVKMVLCTSPAFDPHNEHQIRQVPLSESPYGEIT